MRVETTEMIAANTNSTGLPSSYRDETRRRRKVARERARARVLVAIHLAADAYSLAAHITLRELLARTGLRAAPFGAALRALARAGEVLVFRPELPDPSRVIVLADHPLAATAVRVILDAGWSIDRMSASAWAAREAAAGGA